MAYAPAYMLPDFAQSPDTARPLTLLTEDTRKAPLLEYRYEDTGETVQAPNIPCNQPVRTRIEALQFGLDQAARGLDAKLKAPGLSARDRTDILYWHKVQTDQIEKAIKAYAAMPNQGIPVSLPRSL